MEVGKNMKYGIADDLFFTTSESGKAIEAFIKICPPVDKKNLDREWMEMCGLFIQGWLAKAAEQSAQVDVCLLGGEHEFHTMSNGEYTKVVCGKCGKRG